jgi:hypothetical protein
VINDWSNGIEIDGSNSGPCEFTAILVEDEANMHNVWARGLVRRQVKVEGLS